MRVRHLILLALLGCRSNATPDAAVTGPSASSTSTPSTVASVRVDAGRRRTLTPQEALDAWNDAHNKHDASALEALYAKRLGFYAQTLTNKEAAAKKKAAFTKSPDFAQSLDNVQVNPDDPARQRKEFTLVTFKKTSTIGGKSTEVPASIGVAPDGLITFESDGPTNDKLYSAWSDAESWCEKPGYVVNDVVITPYVLSSKSAFTRMLSSKMGSEMVDAGMRMDTFITCPTACDRSQPRGCGYEFGVLDPTNPRFLYSVLYVDAVSGDVSTEY